MSDSQPPLSVLSRAPGPQVIALADSVLARLSDVQVLRSRTGIVMLPYRDTAKGVMFHLGEVLLTETHVRVTTSAGREVEGYGACLGREAQHATAMAVLDAALRAGIAVNEIDAFVADAARAQAAEDADLWSKVETTRVDMETF